MSFCVIHLRAFHNHAQAIIQYNDFENDTIKIMNMLLSKLAHPPGANGINQHNMRHVKLNFLLTYVENKYTRPNKTHT